VVDGFINAGSDSTTFNLSRTANLGSTAAPSPELGASLVIQSNNGYSYQLTELGNGNYGVAGLNLDVTQNYRLSIATANGEKYLSSYTPVKSSPPIDSISWQKTDSGVTVYANTHDPLNNTRYYRWDYVETWEYHSNYTSYMHFDPSNGTIITNNIEIPHICYGSDNSNNIIIASSAKLSSDIIYLAPLTVVPLNSNKISVRYSILVRQYALTADEYNYWQALQTSTEQTGSLFDQEPSQITGNISCTSTPGKAVIGYVGVGSVAESRIFITNQQVYPWYFDQGCMEILFNSDSADVTNAASEGLLPVEVKFSGPVLVGYYFGAASCVDCTLLGGTTVKPSFW